MKKLELVKDGKREGKDKRILKTLVLVKDKKRNDKNTYQRMSKLNNRELRTYNMRPRTDKQQQHANYSRSLSNKQGERTLDIHFQKFIAVMGDIDNPSSSSLYLHANNHQQTNLRDLNCIPNFPLDKFPDTFYFLGDPASVMYYQPPAVQYFLSNKTPVMFANYVCNPYGVSK